MPFWELAESDCIVIMGSNMAEAHPVAFRYVVQARERGAMVIHVDPRFTRTSAMCNLHVALRPGTDLAFLGGLIRYVLEEGRVLLDYVRAYTNASFLVSEAFQDDQVLGVFSGLAETGYDSSSWDYQRDATGAPLSDPTLEHPRSVWQVLRRHFARYTPEKVQEVCGTPVEEFLGVARALSDGSGRERTSAFCYAVGWTQHTVGVQNIRACAILQLLLGNVGRPGGGILALRGHANIQGATDIATLYHLLPGYLPVPREQESHRSLDAYLETERVFGAPTRAYLVSQLKAWFGEAARAGNDFCYHHLPKVPPGPSGAPGDESFQVIFDSMLRGEVQGLLCIGQNPASGGPNAKLVREGLARLRWLVVRDFFQHETAAFWTPAAGVDPEQVETEVFFLPAANGFEKAGSLTNTMRLVQWHEKAVEPPGDCRSELWFVNDLARRLKAHYAGSAAARDAPVRDLAWSWPVDPRGEPDPEAVLREINGARVESGAQLRGAAELSADGSTACGSWIHCGIFPGPNLARAREPGGRNHPGWAFAWPGNRRILYNRASADPQGRPWSERKRLMEWSEAEGRWIGPDVIDLGADAVPGSADAPFILLDQGLARLYVPRGLADGPLPTHYEPVESPVRENRLHQRRASPVHKRWGAGRQELAEPGDPRYPYALTTYRLTEHYLTGVMSRWLPWLAELMPAPFCELPRALAQEKGVRTGDRVRVVTPRGEIELRALVTSRLATLLAGPEKVHVVGIPWHFGFQGLVKGPVANDLTAMLGDPNVSIQETKALVCDVIKVDRGT